MFKLLLTPIFLVSIVSFGQKKQATKVFSVTGTYRYDGETYRKGDDTYGYYGSIKVKQIGKGRIAMSFFICKGAKSYSSGSFLDTLVLNGSTAIYKTDCDANCTLVFRFTKSGVITIHKDADGDYNSSCCFGHAVVADGYFRKTSSKTPIIKDTDFE